MITSKQLRTIKHEYILNSRMPYLCSVAGSLNIEKEFKEYLQNNPDDTMLKYSRGDAELPQWRSKDKQSRINWLDKHIKILEDDNK